MADGPRIAEASKAQSERLTALHRSNKQLLEKVQNLEVHIPRNPVAPVNPGIITQPGIRHR